MKAAVGCTLMLYPKVQSSFLTFVKLMEFLRAICSLYEVHLAEISMLPLPGILLYVYIFAYFSHFL
jgi:hypothetical protein